MLPIDIHRYFLGPSHPTELSGLLDLVVSFSYWPAKSSCHYTFFWKTGWGEALFVDFRLLNFLTNSCTVFAITLVCLLPALAEADLLNLAVVSCWLCGQQLHFSFLPGIINHMYTAVQFLELTTSIFPTYNSPSIWCDELYPKT